MSPDDIKEFQRTYGTSRDRDLAAQYDMTIAEVEELAAELRLGKDKKRFPCERMPRWTAEEVEQLRALYGRSTNIQIAHDMGRTLQSIIAKAHRLGLKKDHERFVEMGRANVKFRKDRQ